MPNNEPMTRGQRRWWLALEAQKRRRARLDSGAVVGLVLSSPSPDQIVWSWSGVDPVHWNIYASDDGAAFTLATTIAGGLRRFFPDSGAQWLYVVGVDGAGTEITPHSIALRPNSVVHPDNTIVLSSDGHGRLSWVLGHNYGWGLNVYHSVDGVTWGDLYDMPDAGANGADESGVAGYFRLCQRDGLGSDIEPYSNAVHSDGA